MRLHFHLTPNAITVPWAYHQNLAGWLHSRLRDDDQLHAGISLYSMSNLSHGRPRRGGLDFEGGSSFFLSSQRDELLVELMGDLLGRNGRPTDRDPRRIAWGMYVESVDMERTPSFGEAATFWAKSPVLIRERREDGTKEHVLFGEERADELLTRVLHTKQEYAGLAAMGRVRFDRSYTKAKSKLVEYKGIRNRGSLCPVIVEGGPEVCAFVWNVGVGHSTGIGFGALEVMKLDAA